MINPQILDYIKQQLQQGTSLEKIKGALLAQGWQESDFDEAVKTLSVSEEKDVKNSPATNPASNPASNPTSSPVSELTRISEPTSISKSESIPTSASISLEKPDAVSVSNPTSDLSSNSTYPQQSSTISTSINPEPISDQKSQVSGQINSTNPSKGGGKKIMVLISIIIVALALIGGGVFAYLNYFQPTQTSDEVIAMMFEKTGEIKTVNFSGSLDLKIDSESFIQTSNIQTSNQAFSTSSKIEPTPQKMSFKSKFVMSGSADLVDQKNPKSQISFDYTMDNPELQFLQNQADSSLIPKELSFSIEAKTNNENIFLKLVKIPALGLIDISFIENQWLRINFKQFDEQFNQTASSTGQSPLTFQNNYKELTPEQIKQLQNLFQQNKIIKITKVLPIEKIDEQDNFHYQFIIDKEGLKSFILEAIRIMNPEKISQDDINKMNESFVNWKDLPKGEIWINKKDYLPSKIKLSINSKQKNEAYSINMDIESNWSFKFNQPVKIEMPEEFMDLNELIQTFMGGLETKVPANVLP